MTDVCTEPQLRAFLPAAPRLDVWCPALNTAMSRFQINSVERAAAFLAQVAHESNQFRNLVENLNYSADRLVNVWPKRFPTLEAATPYERQPEKLANYVYASRLGNGDSASGDGWRFRGRGLWGSDFRWKQSRSGWNRRMSQRLQRRSSGRRGG